MEINNNRTATGGRRRRTIPRPWLLNQKREHPSLLLLPPPAPPSSSSSKQPPDILSAKPKWNHNMISWSKLISCCNKGNRTTTSTTKSRTTKQQQKSFNHGNNYDGIFVEKHRYHYHPNLNPPPHHRTVYTDELSSFFATTTDDDDDDCSSFLAPSIHHYDRHHNDDTSSFCSYTSSYYDEDDDPSSSSQSRSRNQSRSGSSVSSFTDSDCTEFSYSTDDEESPTGRGRSKHHRHHRQRQHNLEQEESEKQLSQSQSQPRQSKQRATTPPPPSTAPLSSPIERPQTITQRSRSAGLPPLNPSSSFLPPTTTPNVTPLNSNSGTTGTVSICGNSAHNGQRQRLDSIDGNMTRTSATTNTSRHRRSRAVVNFSSVATATTCTIPSPHNANTNSTTKTGMKNGNMDQQIWRKRDCRDGDRGGASTTKPTNEVPSSKIPGLMSPPSYVLCHEDQSLIPPARSFSFSSLDCPQQQQPRNYTTPPPPPPTTTTTTTTTTMDDYGAAGPDNHNGNNHNWMLMSAMTLDDDHMGMSQSWSYQDGGDLRDSSIGCKNYSYQSRQHHDEKKSQNGEEIRDSDDSISSSPFAQLERKLQTQEEGININSDEFNYLPRNKILDNLTLRRVQRQPEGKIVLSGWIAVTFGETDTFKSRLRRQQKQNQQRRYDHHHHSRHNRRCSDDSGSYSSSSSSSDALSSTTVPDAQPAVPIHHDDIYYMSIIQFQEDHACDGGHRSAAVLIVFQRDDTEYTFTVKDDWVCTSVDISKRVGRCVQLQGLSSSSSSSSPTGGNVGNDTIATILPVMLDQSFFTSKGKGGDADGDQQQLISEPKFDQLYQDRLFVGGNGRVYAPDAQNDAATHILFSLDALIKSLGTT